MTPMQQDQQNQPVAPPPSPVAAPYKPALPPRANGALLLALGTAAEGFNAFTLFNESTFYPKLLIIGTVLMPIGLWTLVTGIAYDKKNPVKPPTWWTVGVVVLTIIGVIAGIGLTAVISD